VNLRKITAGLLIGLVAAGITLLLSSAGALEKLELAAYDWRIRTAARPETISKDIVLVDINETSIRDLAPFLGRWPWPRVVFGWLVNYLNRGPARVVAIDFTFAEPDGTLGARIGGNEWPAEKSDLEFAEAVKRSRASVLLADARYVGTEGALGNAPPDWSAQARPFRLGPAIDAPGMVLPPFPALLDAATLLGHNYLPLDPDGTARRMPPFVREGNRYVPSLGIGAALLAGGFRPEDVVLDGEAILFRDRRMPLVTTRVNDLDDPQRQHDQLTTLINYQAPFLSGGERAFTSYEVRHLLASEEQLQSDQKPLVDPAVFKDKIVFIGLASSGLVDVFSTPFGVDKGNMPGIQLHATMADNLLSNRFIRPASGGARIGTVIAAGLLVGLMAALLPFTPAAAGTLLAVAGWTWFSLASFKDGLWLNMAQPLLTMGLALFAGTTYQYFVEGREKRVVKRLFGRYVSRDVYQQLLAHPELAELGGSRREMTVLFSDIRGFTSMTEKGNAEELVAQLNDYFSTMVEVVFRHHGTVDKFVGDMVMALFGAPVDDADHAEHALAAAIEMVGQLGELNRRWLAEGKVQLDIGIGINSGDMIAGNIGSQRIMSYTVIGDNVNLGSRLESLNKEFQTRIIISDATRTRLRTAPTLRPLGEVTVKGKSLAVSLFEVVVPSPIAAESPAPEERQS
jgi:adenylate cyclase